MFVESHLADSMCDTPNPVAIRYVDRSIDNKMSSVVSKAPEKKRGPGRPRKYKR